MLTALFFMGVIHEGYICEQCGLYYSISVRKLAKAYEEDIWICKVGGMNWLHSCQIRIQIVMWSLNVWNICLKALRGVRICLRLITPIRRKTSRAHCKYPVGYAPCPSQKSCLKNNGTTPSIWKKLKHT